MESPTLMMSVIMPAFQAARYLPQSLAALERSDLPRECWELIVVDDSSLDGSSDIAGRYADTVVRLRGGPRGPAYARNRGFEVARGAILVSIDADVCVHPDVLRLFAAQLGGDTTLGAVVGTYDTLGGGTSVATAYRILRHAHLRRRGAGDVDDFWPACGAVRREVVEQVGAFDEWHYWRPQVEGAEFGRRIRGAGFRIWLNPSIAGAHLKEWSLVSSLRTDMLNHGLPWMRLLFQGSKLTRVRAPGLSALERVNAFFTAATFTLLLLYAARPSDVVLKIGAVSAIGVLAGNLPFLAFASRERGVLFAITCVPMQLMHYLIGSCAVIVGWLMHQLVGEPRRDVASDAYSEVGLKTWPPVPRRLPVDAWQLPPLAAEASRDPRLGSTQS